MSDDASSKGARKLPMVDGNSPEIREDSRAIQFVDLICESTTLNGTLYVSLGSLVQDQDAVQRFRIG